MPLFGGKRDISLFRHLNRELLNKIIEQKVGYYVLDLDKTKSNIYGESTEKFYKDPVLINCLIERGDREASNGDIGIDIDRKIVVRFLRDDLAGLDITTNGFNYNIVPAIGDIILWNENYYEIDNVNENQLFVGKDPSYSYDSTTNGFGTSLSIIVTAIYVRPERFNLKQQRL